MANIIDSLFVTLGLDAGAFTKGSKVVQQELDKTGKTAEKTSEKVVDAQGKVDDAIEETGKVVEKNRKKHEAESKKTAEAFDTVRNSILGITAAIVSAVAGGEFLSFLTKNDTAVANLGRNVGSTGREVGLLEGVFRRMGASTGDAEGFLRTTNKILQDIKLTGTSGALQPFVQAGLDVAKFRDAASMQERLQLLSNTAKKMNPQDAQSRLQAAGYSEETINILLQNRMALSDLFEKQKELNSVSQQDIDMAFQRQYATSTLTQRFEGLGRKISTNLTPAIDFLIDGLDMVVKWLSDNSVAATALTVALGGITVALTAMKVSGAITFFANLTGGMGAATAAATGLLGVLGSISKVFAAGALGYAFGSWLNDKLGLDDKISDLFTGPDPSMAGGYVPGTIKGLGNKGGSGNSGGSGSSLGARNNNPGNLRLAGQTGATSGAGGFAEFPSLADGLSALDGQLTLDFVKRGLTLSQQISKYATASDKNNVPAYIADISRQTGIGANQVPNASNSNVMQALMMAYSKHEGNPVDLASISAGMNLAQSRGQGVGAPSVTIQNMEIKTTASTMTGTGADLGKGLHSYMFAQQANVGVQ